MYEIAHGSIASGKTTKAIQWLDEQGGGYLITKDDPRVLQAVLKNIYPALKNPDKIYFLDGNKAFAVDDADSHEVKVRLVVSRYKN